METQMGAQKRNMIVSAVSLYKKFNLKNPLEAKEWELGVHGKIQKSHVSYSGHKVSDGSVRIYARFFRPYGRDKRPAILLLPDAGKAMDEELMTYFTEKGYAVLMPDYSGKSSTDGEGVNRTVYPPSLTYGNYEFARGLYDMNDLDPDKTTWFEWTYVALYSIEYLKSREDIGAIGIVGVRKGGELAWKAMLSPDVKCGVPINAAGWYSFQSMGKFAGNIAHHLSDDHHRYIAAVESQSYAPSVKCPVLMLCSLRDSEFDCDRAYDTYCRIGNTEENALVYSTESGVCIGPNGLADMDLFLEKNLKGREIYIPDTLNVKLKEVDGELEITVECDKEGLLEEAGVFYAEADVTTKSTYRDWRCVHVADGRSVKNGEVRCRIQPFAGATAVFAFGYAKYINGFRVMSKITSKKLSTTNGAAIKSKHLFSGKELDSFSVAEYAEYSIANILLERDAMPRLTEGYGGIKGAYSMGGIRTYKISSPRYIPEENALLEFDVYSAETQQLKVEIEVADLEKGEASYTCIVDVRGGGKWKRMILRAADFKDEKTGRSLENFKKGSALVFDCAGEEKEFSVTNILWL
ncbi:MAG: hypothetical protein IJX49_06650 [Clostridia bacterium]|nr:hypothetical protein [Clostridia bacterium]